MSDTAQPELSREEFLLVRKSLYEGAGPEAEALLTRHDQAQRDKIAGLTKELTLIRSIHPHPTLPNPSPDPMDELLSDRNTEEKRNRMPDETKILSREEVEMRIRPVMAHQAKLLIHDAEQRASIMELDESLEQAVSMANDHAAEILKLEAERDSLRKERDAALALLMRPVKVTIGTSVLTRDLVWCGGCRRGLSRTGNWHHCPQCGGQIDQDSYRLACLEAERHGGNIARYISGEGADQIKKLEAERDAAVEAREGLQRLTDEQSSEIEDHAFLVAHVKRVTAHVAGDIGIHSERQFDALMDDVRALAKVSIDDSHYQCNALRTELSALRTKLKSAVEAGKTDRARLDWLEKRRVNLNAHYGTSYGWKFVGNHNVNRMYVRDVNTLDLNDAEACGGDIRTAIDAAMLADQEGTDAA